MGVARKNPIPASVISSITSSSQSVWNTPSAGSSIAHEKMPSETVFTFARRISSMSSRQVSRSDCSGLQSPPNRKADGANGADGLAGMRTPGVSVRGIVAIV